MHFVFENMGINTQVKYNLFL